LRRRWDIHYKRALDERDVNTLGARGVSACACARRRFAYVD